MPRDDPRLERFCEDTCPRLVAALTHHCRDVHLAEELAQEALIEACRRWEHVGGLESSIGWCYRVGVNLANSWFRRRRIERRARIRLGLDHDSTHDDLDVDKEAADVS